MSDMTFHFDNYELSEPKTLVLHYSYRDGAKTLAHFAERYQLPVSLDSTVEGLCYILQQLHIIVGISYYKTRLSPVILPYELTEAEAEYWNTVYDNGLGEYAYVNQLTEPIRPFRPSTAGELHAPVAKPDFKGALLGIGGGKDSIVAGELLKGLGLDTMTMAMATGDHHGQAGPVMEVMGLEQLRVERYLDPSLKSFKAKYGGYSGHIPLSAILAWLGILLAYATNRRYVIMANEAATSVGNVSWQGRMVNHQWSKSLDFERLTQTFVRQYVTSDIVYFSPIRPYGSLAVMILFAKLGRAYFDDFTSCNLVLRIDPEQRPNGRWCTHCAKCLSTWLLLSLVLPVEQLERIFGRNLFDDTSLRPLLDALLGLQGHKPLDCVGTTEELRAVTRQALQAHPDVPLLQGLTVEMISGPDSQTLIAELGEAAIPSELQERIQQYVAASLAAAL